MEQFPDHHDLPADFIIVGKLSKPSLPTRAFSCARRNPVRTLLFLVTFVAFAFIACFLVSAQRLHSNIPISLTAVDISDVSSAPVSSPTLLIKVETSDDSGSSSLAGAVISNLQCTLTVVDAAVEKPNVESSEKGPEDTDLEKNPLASLTASFSADTPSSSSFRVGASSTSAPQTVSLELSNWNHANLLAVMSAFSSLSIYASLSNAYTNSNIPANIPGSSHDNLLLPHSPTPVTLGYRCTLDVGITSIISPSKPLYTTTQTIEDSVTWTGEGMAKSRLDKEKLLPELSVQEKF